MFRGCEKESNARHIIGECNCRVLDALAGEFRGRGRESNARHIIGECNCRVVDALAGEFRGCGKESSAPAYYWGMQPQSVRRIVRSLKVADRKAMCGFKRKVKKE